MTIVCVPDVDKTGEVRNPPLVPIVVGAMRLVPSGLRIDTEEELMVTALMIRPTLDPAVPSKTTRAFCPALVVVTVTVGPSGVIVANTSFAPKTVRVADLVLSP